MSEAESALGLAPGSFPYASRFVEVSGARVHYIDEGSGPVLLMLHGNPTWSYVFRHLVFALRDRFRCVALDYPGFGRSTAPAGFGYRPEDHARVVDAFVDRLDLAPLTPIVGDWGGPIGIHLAARDPARIERLVIGNTWSWPVDGDPHFEIFSRVMGGPLGRLAIRNFNAFVNVMVPAGVKRGRVPPATMAAYRAPLATPEARMPTWVFPRAIRSSRDFLAECERALGSLAAKPTLIVWGAEDFAFRIQERERFERALPDHRTVILEGVGHFVWEDAPLEIATAIRAWWPA